MFRIGRKKNKEKASTAPSRPKATVDVPSDASFVGAFPGRPWERLTNIRHGKGSRIKVLSDEDQQKVIEIAARYFGSKANQFAQARVRIQQEMDEPQGDSCVHFFSRATFLEKRLAVRAYLSDADGRFIRHEVVLPLLKAFADAGLDFEVGAIDHYPEGQRKTEIVVGDGTEVISDQGYWFAHTHPARSGVTNNILPSTQDLDVMLSTARSYYHMLEKTETQYYVMRDIGATRVTVTTHAERAEGHPASANIDKVHIEYFYSGGEDENVEDHARTLANHLRMRHGIDAQQIEMTPLKSSPI